MTNNSNIKIITNKVSNRFLPLSESVRKGLEPETKITDFNIIKILGSGSFGKVLLAKHKKTNQEYALKLIDKTNKNNIEGKPYFRREIEIMYKLHHKNCIKLYGHFEDEEKCYFIMEYISNGNLYSFISCHPNNILPPETVTKITKELVSAVYYLHNMTPPIIHRDIKPENILLDENNSIKLTDFGWSNYINLTEVRNTFCGTPLYLSPEMIIGNSHNENVDVWCIGVIIFELLVGRIPFAGRDKNTLLHNIIRGNISWGVKMDEDAVDLIKKILVVDPNFRIGLDDIIKHKFIKKFSGEFNINDYLIKPSDEHFINEPFIISKETPESHLKNIVEKEKKIREEEEKKMGEEEEKKLREEKEKKMREEKEKKLREGKEKKLREEEEKKLREEEEKKLREEKEKNQKDDKKENIELSNEQIELFKKIDKIFERCDEKNIINNKNKTQEDSIKFQLFYLNLDYKNLLSQYSFSEEEKKKTMHILEGINKYIFRLENKNFVLEETNKEKDKIIQNQDNEIKECLKKINEQENLLKEAYLLLKGNNTIPTSPTRKKNHDKIQKKNNL